jgi:hypothetical protein
MGDGSAVDLASAAVKTSVSGGGAEHAPPTVSRPPTGIPGRGNMSYNGTTCATSKARLPSESVSAKCLTLAGTCITFA